jgi:hypothetical protein
VGLWLVDIVLAATLAEGALLFAWHARSGRGLPPGVLLPMLGAGLFLLLGARALLTGAPLAWAGAAFAAAGLAHALDLARRLRR